MPIRKVYTSCSTSSRCLYVPVVVISHTPFHGGATGMNYYKHKVKAPGTAPALEPIVAYGTDRPVDVRRYVYANSRKGSTPSGNGLVCHAQSVNVVSGNWV